MARILIIDDENNIRLMVRLGLSAAGHEVDTAGDGAEGLAKFGDGTGWDLTLLDQRMPGAQGLEVLRQLRRRDAGARVIMITAFGTIDLAADAMRAGATDFLRKPFTMDVLRSVVQAALAPATSADQPAKLPGSSPVMSPLPFGLTSINGYRIASNDEGPRRVPAGSGLHCDFDVRRADGVVQPVGVELPAYLIELVKAHTDREKMPDEGHFWRWLGEEALANYLWQHGEVPPDGMLRVDDLTTGLRRWIDAVLTN